MKLNLNFERTHVDQPDSNRDNEGDGGHRGAVTELKRGEGLVVNINADDLGRVARPAPRKRVDEPEDRDSRDSRNQHVKKDRRHYQWKRDESKGLARRGAVDTSCFTNLRRHVAKPSHHQYQRRCDATPYGINNYHGQAERLEPVYGR